MTEILALLQPIAPLISKTTLRQLSRVIFGMLAITGRVTMLGISRWTGKSGSYRTVQRLYNTILPWSEIFCSLFRTLLFQPGDEYILAGDEVVVSKAGDETYGKDCIFSSLAQRPIPGLAFFAFSLINVRLRRSSPIKLEQVVRSEEEKAACKAKAQARKTKKKKRARSASQGDRRAARTRINSKSSSTQSSNGSKAC